MSCSEIDLHKLLEMSANGDEGASEELVIRFNRLIQKESFMNGMPNEDVAQDIRAELIRAVQRRYKAKQNSE
ncbi:helix-turn-helix domain-containing protein [Alicyclobacillus acidoterrestris]|uniref:Helix-turn-helix domain-containing protein n=1 Tax=Alicyclobacillus acidoterrestris (strain ATCC 49025 / DSM 3922 / CIP 106132 / NCIMB 13137 / GD3B) TaxID=1356854 RepID=T0DUK1_ALIAG|nr:helix-turn-helix domain-containing protein [Alicyclobacillus acidoterrestris]EPZ53161.1 hypothetical protein N007_17925 [Alicyclobacillus acidoterrestris ATCC 49025]UNO49427.1 helix-turn-helix domain-containing protein [Alicyclobacillus acidoterrestris]